MLMCLSISFKIASILYIIRGIDIILIKLQQPENPTNTYMRHPED